MANYIVNAYNDGGSGGSVNMRTGPGKSYGLVVRVPHGETVTGTKSGTWSYMTYGKYAGYMMSVFLDDTDTPVTDGNWITRWTNTPGETVNVRSGAGKNYTIVRKLSHGTKVEVNAPTSVWSQVRLYNTTSILGYIMTEFLSDKIPGSSSGGNEGSAEGNYTICLTVETDRFGTGTSVRFREKASTNSKELASIPGGTPVMVTTRDGEWLPTRYNGVNGYIQAKFLSGSTEYTKWISGVTRTVPYNREAAVAYARKYTSDADGTASYNNAQYNPVGDSPTKINKDCANYVSQCLFAGGMPMHDGWYYRYPGDSNPTVNAAWKGTNSQKKAIAARKFGERVYDISKLKKGDIVYSYDTAKNDGTFGHVVILSEDVGNSTTMTVCGHTDNQKDEPRSKKAKDAYFHIYDDLPVKSTDYFG